MTCPSDDQLSRLLDGELASQSSNVSEHLESCPHCRIRLERLAAGDATWDAVSGGIRTPQTVPELAAAMAALKTAATAADESASPDLPPGFLRPPREPGNLGRLGDFEIYGEVGRGEMGIVLKAFDERLERVVALKVMSPRLAGHATSRKRFIREGRAAAAVCHEHVVTIHAVHEDALLPYIVMQFVGGQSLQQRLDKSGAMTVAEILRIGMQSAAGLAAAHTQGLVHRDIKPANILLENGVERVKITDFGLARAVDDASLTKSGIISGTPLYMAPEQARGEPVDHRADLFSLGCVLYTLATGRSPFRAPTTLAVLRRICDDQPRPIREMNPEIPDWLATIVIRLLAKNPDERFSSAKELSELLAGCLAHVQRPGSVPLPSAVAGPPQFVSKMDVPPPLSPEGRRRSWLLTTPGGIAILCLAAIGPMMLALFCAGGIAAHWMDARGVERQTAIIEPPPVAIEPGIPISSAAELAELKHLLAIAQEQMDVARAQFEGGVMASGEYVRAQIEFATAQQRYHRATGNAAEYLAASERRVKLCEQLVGVHDELFKTGRVTGSERLAAQRELSEAKLELNRAAEMRTRNK